MNTIRRLIKELENGVKVNDYVVYGKYVGIGRFIEEHNVHVYIRHNVYENIVLYMKLFEGRRPYYKPWIELFNIRRNVRIGSRVIGFFDSIIEDTILDLVSRYLSGGEKIYIEYINDDETSTQLNRGYPIPVTRLGYKLFLRGFTWFKNWYFPEGFMEGNPKLQGEKPANKQQELSQLKEIMMEVETFLKQHRREHGDIYLEKSITRGREILVLARSRIQKLIGNRPVSNEMKTL